MPRDQHLSRLQQDYVCSHTQVVVYVCMRVLQVLGYSKQTHTFSKNTRVGGYPSNQDTREVKAKKVEEKIEG